MDRAALFGYSEGGPLSIVYAAMYPERVQALAVYGSFARLAEAPDYPPGVPRDTLRPLLDYVSDRWGTGRAMLPFIQHVPDRDDAWRVLARYERGACTPPMAVHILDANGAIDVRPILPTVAAPTLILHSASDPLLSVLHGAYLAEHIPNARLVTGDADFHMPWDGETIWFYDELETFLTGDQPHARPSERFLGTVLLTDLVGSTEHAATVGDATWRTLLDRHDALTENRVRAFGGRVIKTTGDGVVATLDGPSRAIECAVSIREAVSDLGLRIRAGVHTGEFERRGDDIGGLDVNIGSRVLALAEPDEVWVSRTVKDLTSGSGLQFADRGRHRLKGVPDEWELYSPAGLTPRRLPPAPARRMRAPQRDAGLPVTCGEPGEGVVHGQHPRGQARAADEPELSADQRPAGHVAPSAAPGESGPVDSCASRGLLRLLSAPGRTTPLRIPTSRRVLAGCSSRA